jgi:cell division protein FtsN
MPRDYKHHSARRKQRNPVAPWVGLLAGLLIGLFVAFLIYIKMLDPKTPELAGGTAVIAETGDDAATPPAEPVEPDAGNKAAPPKPRFEFYAILPEMEVVVPEEEIQASIAQPAPKPAPKPAPVAKKSTRKQPAALKEIYYLQAGSFSGAAQADRFKAKLAMMGFETDVQTITINGKDTRHRVRVGPFRNLTTLQQARSKLDKQGIDTYTVKIKG